MVFLNKALAPGVDCTFVKFEAGLLFLYNCIDLGGVLEASAPEFGTEAFKRRRNALCRAEAHSDKVRGNSVFCGRVLQKGLFGGVMFEIGIKKVEGVAAHRGV